MLGRLLAAGLMGCVALILGTAAQAGETALSPAQQAVVAKRMARATPAEKQVVEGWSDAQTLAQFFCAKTGRAVVTEQVQGADRIVLAPGREGANSLALDGNTKLTGNGIVRVGPFFKDFTFECTLDADKGTVKTFTFQLKQSTNGPAPSGAGVVTP